MKTGKAITTLAIILSVAFLTASSALAEDNGRAVAEKSCVTSCHGSVKWKSVNKSTDEWNRTVDDMVRWGAEVTNTSIVAEYLVSQTDPKWVDVSQSQSTGQAQQVNTPQQVSTPVEQAYTGAEVWLYVLGGGSMMATGFSMRRKLSKA